ncbi:MAG: ACP S-malonyltransferase [Pseudomonadales bacterium]|nr:ACP S-malonyltransferase [Pseudomonadales bacterium]
MSLGFLFPGQGSQTVGMLAELAAAFPIIGETFAEADEALSLPLTRIVQEGPAERLSETEITQPALLTSSVALWRLWQSRGGAVPVLFAGHSLGEYSALVCGGAISFADGVRLVHQRGRLMQQAVPRGEGAMAAILGLDDETVAQ